MALNKDNNFLQSDIWRKFQEAVGHQTFYLELKSPSNPPFEKGEGTSFSVSIIEHKLPVVGKYFYIPRGPMFELGVNSELNSESELSSERFRLMVKIIDLAKKNNIGWIRIEPENVEALEFIKKNVDYKIVKAPYDMQPKEIFVIDISRSETELLAGMKSKTRYNIKLAEKKEVSVSVIPAKAGIHGTDLLDSGSEAGMTKKYIEEFIRLIKLTEKRKDVKFHSANYYQKMLEIIPNDILKLYVAEYNNKIIAANLVIFYNNTAIYLHGATDDEYRNVMAPYLLQWQAIKDAKIAGCKFYDFGGVKTCNMEHGTYNKEKIPNTSWSGITKFKLGFASETESVEFPGSQDIIIHMGKYLLYKLFSGIIKIIKN